MHRPFFRFAFFGHRPILSREQESGDRPETERLKRELLEERRVVGSGAAFGCGGNPVRATKRYRASRASVGERLAVYSATVLTSSLDPKQCFCRHHLAQYTTALLCPPWPTDGLDRDRPQPTSVLPRVPHLSARSPFRPPMLLSPSEVTCASLASSPPLNRIGVCTDKATSFSHSEVRVGLGQGLDS